MLALSLRYSMINLPWSISTPIAQKNTACISNSWIQSNACMLPVASTKRHSSDSFEMSSFTLQCTCTWVVVEIDFDSFGSCSLHYPPSGKCYAFFKHIHSLHFPSTGSARGLVAELELCKQGSSVALRLDDLLRTPVCFPALSSTVASTSIRSLLELLLLELEPFFLCTFCFCVVL